MRLISQHGQFDGSTGRDNRQIKCPLRASRQYKAGYVPGNSHFELRCRTSIGTEPRIRELWQVVGSSLRDIRRQ
jgi:hypothetical protein